MIDSCGTVHSYNFLFSCINGLVQGKIHKKPYNCSTNLDPEVSAVVDHEHEAADTDEVADIGEAHQRHRGDVVHKHLHKVLQQMRCHGYSNSKHGHSRQPVVMVTTNINMCTILFGIQLLYTVKSA